MESAVKNILNEAVESLVFGETNDSINVKVFEFNRSYDKNLEAVLSSMKDVVDYFIDKNGFVPNASLSSNIESIFNRVYNPSSNAEINTLVRKFGSLKAVISEDDDFI